MAVFISKETNDKLQSQIKDLVKDYESKRDPNKLYKFTGHAFVDTKLHAKFVDGKSECAYHAGKLIGNFSLVRQSPTDVGFPIPLAEQFNEFRLTHKDFTLRLSYVNDGCFANNIATAHSNGVVQLADFTDYSDC